MYLTYGFMSGCGHITSYNSCSLVVLQYFIKWRSLAVGIVQSSPAIGVLAITQLTQAWLDEFGWRWALRGLAGLYFICALCSAVFVPLDHQAEEKNWDEDMIIKPPVEQTRTLSLLGNRPFLILLASVAVNHLANYVPIMHIVSTRYIHPLHYIHTSIHSELSQAIFLATKKTNSLCDIILYTKLSCHTLWLEFPSILFSRKIEGDSQGSHVMDCNLRLQELKRGLLAWENTANIWRHHRRLSLEITSKDRLKKFHTDEWSIPRTG